MIVYHTSRLALSALFSDERYLWTSATRLLPHSGLVFYYYNFESSCGENFAAETCGDCTSLNTIDKP